MAISNYAEHKHLTPTGPGPIKKPGLVYREQQVADLQKEAQQVRGASEDVNMPITGNVATRTQLAVAKSGLQRQQQLRKQRGY